MIRVQQEDAVIARAIVGETGRFTGVPKHHVKKVCRVVELVIRVHEGLANRELIAHGCDCWHFRNQAERGYLTMPRVRDVCGIMIKRRQCADDAAHDGHWVSVASKPVEECSDLLMNHRVARHNAHKLGFLLGTWQFTV